MRDFEAFEGEEGGMARRRGGRTQQIGLLLGPLLAAGLLCLSGRNPEGQRVAEMAAVAAWMATWWITEAVPLAATALLPLVLYPLLGIASGKAIAPVYVNHLIFLFVGGFLIALAMERWNLHRRIALTIIDLFGGSSSSIIIGFMVATAFLSMWISNTATTVMMVPIALSIILRLEAQQGVEKTGTFSKILMLSIAYSASIGGVATLVGTPPNLSYSRIFELSFPGAPSVGFGQWLLIGLPISLVGLVTAYLVLSKVIFRRRHDLHLDREVIRAEKRELGAMRFEERVVLAIFALTASLWIFRKDLELGGVVIQGWADLLPYSALVDDGTVAIFMALFLFLIPARSRPGGGPAQRDKDNDKDEARAVRLLDVSVFARIPWHIILLFGGGFALASGFRTSGLSDFIGGRFSALQGAPTILFVGVISGGMTFLTELTSNTATTELILPILASIATELKVDPRLFMVPATISASFAFMLPAATPPNAIVFASERLRVADMVRAGILLNLLGILLITLMLLLLLPIAFGVSLQEAPPWIEG